MYPPNEGLGFWKQLFSFGSRVFSNVGVPVLINRLTSSGGSGPAPYVLPTSAVVIPPVSAPQTPKADTIIPGVSNMIVLGGAAMVALLILRRR